ncbi:MAG: hypothetical protein JNK30_08915 [Phenylobacterium sp.]|uniref:hypothetical protein n=1 Tax=Phenylobacterium sp. TaxID=1871053 RepID=UPI001A572620|nr:hypothetical protein [Phenylobacterium sp.]MBL8771489.1 hypothetical protein [Phenylobacterium sp.]
MPGLSERKIQIVRTLVETAPDSVVGSLQAALSETAADSALGTVRRLVESEYRERALRNLILQPVAPMCVGSGQDPKKLTFPARALAQLWRGLRLHHGPTIDEVRAAFEEQLAPHEVQKLTDALTAAAAAGLRAADLPEFAAAGDACEQARPGGRDTLATCLDVAPVVRRATERLHGWLTHPGADASAAARLAYRDAVAVSDDAGPLFFEMLAAQMAQPWMVLRVISAVMDKPTERYLRDSELAGFAETLLDEIDAGLGHIAGLKADDGPAAGRDAARRAELIVQQIVELETCIDLTRDTGWGRRIHQQRASLASVVEGRLHEAEKAVVEALPMHVPRQRARRAVPQLADPPQERLVNRAITLLSFSEDLRATANYGGFSATRNRLIETLGEHIDYYVEEVLDLVRTHEVENLHQAQAFLEHAAAFDRLIRGAPAAELIHRRIHATIHPEPAVAQG